MKLQGIGMVSAQGRGIDALRSALENGPTEPDRIECPFQNEAFPVYSVATETLKDRAVLRGARRADRFSKMAALAAVDAVQDAGAELNPERTGLVLGTAFGPHPTVFDFLDELLEFGDAGVSPTLFSHSVHNAAASYISTALGLAGPTMTITSFVDPFRQSLQLAQNWIDQNVCDSVLVGATEECGAVMEYIVSQKLKIATSGMKPFFAEDGPEVIPGEGAVFFLLSRDSGSLALTLDEDADSAPDLWVVDFESTVLPDSAPAGCWSHLFGSSPLSTAASCAIGGLMLREQAGYAQTSLVETNLEIPARIGCAGSNGTLFYLEKG